MTTPSSEPSDTPVTSVNAENELNTIINEVEAISGVKVSWLTPAVRKGIYGVIASVGSILIALGVVSPNTTTQILGLVGMVGNFLGAMVAFAHVTIKPGEAIATKTADK